MKSSRVVHVTGILGFVAASLLLAACVTDEDDGSAPNDPVVPDAKRVFASSQVMNGNLGGLPGADSLCGYWANAAGLEGSWKAFLSANGVNAPDRITEVGPWYNVNQRALVFNNKSGFTVGAVVAIRTEYDRTAHGNAWTGTRSTGVVDGTQHCDNWTSGSGSVFASVGTPSQNVHAGPLWMATGGNAPSCFTQQRVYCFEQ